MIASNTPSTSLCFTVLVLPSVNEPGLEVVRALQKSPRFRVIGASSVDSHVDPSRALCRTHLHLPALGVSDFEHRLERAVREHNVDFIFPTVDALVEALAGKRPGGARVIAPGPDTAALCMSKTATALAVGDRVATPRIFEPAEALPGVAWAKPDCGSGSRNAFLVHDAADLALARARGLLVMEYLPGEEYTVDCCSTLDHRLVAASVRRRVSVGRGIALASELVADEQIEGLVAVIAERLKLAGPWFAQFKRRADGTPVLMEVNARVGGSMGLTRLGGVNIPQLAVWSFAGYEVRAPRRLDGVRAVRSLTTVGELDGFELIVWDLDDTLLRPDRKPDPDLVARVVDFSNRGVPQVVLSRNSNPAAELARAHLLPFFAEVVQTDDKRPAFGALLARRGVDQARVLHINDSVAERLLLEPLYPGVTWVAPDALDLVARERL